MKFTNAYLDITLTLVIFFFKIVDPETNEILGVHQRGEIHIRTLSFMKGYMGLDHVTNLDEEGFFKTGDLGYYDTDGYFFIVGRIKEIIKYHGDQVTIFT